MNLALFIGMAQAIFLSALLGVKKDRKPFDYVLIAWLLLNAVYLYYFYLNFIGDTDRNLPFLLLTSILAYLTAPLLYLYVCALIIDRPFQISKYLYHFIPYLFFAGSILYYYLYAGDSREIWVQDGYIHLRGSFPFHMRFHALLMAVSSFAYPLLSLYLLYKHRTRIEREFSYLEMINLNWLRYWIVISIIGFWITFGIIWAGTFEWVGVLFSFKVTAGLIVASIFFIGFYGLKQAVIFTTSPNAGNNGSVSNSEKQEKYKGSALNRERSNELLQELNLLMEEERVFLKSDISIEELAEMLNSTKHKLSQVINEQTGMNFFYFVNKYRVEEFKKRLESGTYDHLSLLGLALETGFNSKSSFNAVFKKIEGVTPSQYKQNLAK